MSASLVGSEMCIRDSPAFAVPSRCCPVPSRLFRPMFLQDLSLERSKPVSYTHLTLPTICSV
eukprot:2371292-Alexandrium_andersonii.AAC.1